MSEDSSVPSLASLLAELATAQAAGNDELVLSLRLALARRRFPPHEAELAITTATRGDVALLHGLMLDLKRRQRYREALNTLDLLTRCVVDDLYLCWYYLLHRSHCDLALLDFPSAAESISQVLGTVAGALDGTKDRLLDSIFALVPPDTSPEDLHELRMLAMYSLARYWAAIGRLGAADATLTELVDRLRQQPVECLSCDELNLFLAEIRIDYGRLSEIEQLLPAQGTAESGTGLVQKGQILRGAVLLMTGQLSRADACLKQVLASAHLKDAGSIAIAHHHRVALWQRCHVLLALNRLDDAEEQLDLLYRSKSAVNDALDLDLLAALLRARRMSGDREQLVPLTAKDVLDPMAMEPPGQPPVGGADDGMASIQWETSPARRCERIRDDWTLKANAVQLCLHAGRVEQACKLFVRLQEWTEKLDSPLIANRCEHLAALVYYYSRNYPAAESAATGALTGYVDLGLPGDEWAVCRLLLWILRRQDVSPEQLLELQQREHLLMSRLKAGLITVDRILFGLNKWSGVDEYISHLCHRLHERGLDATPRSWPGRLLQHWRIRRSLRRIVELRRWEELELRSSPVPTVSPDRVEEGAHSIGPTVDLSDPYTQAQRQIQLKQQRSQDHSIRWLMSGWLSASAALLHYLVLPDRIELFVTMRSGCQLLTLSSPVSRVQLWHLVRRCLRRLHYGKWGDPSLSSALSELRRALGMDQVLALLPAQIRQLYIVPDDVLFHVPFAAVPLDERAGVPLIQRFSLALVPALRWHGCPLGQGQSLHHGLGVAVPSSLQKDSDGRAYETLLHASDEVKSVEVAATWSKFVLLPNEQATKAQVLGALSHAQVAHFACHGEFVPDAPHRSGLLLQDGFLTIEDLRSVSLHGLDLAVLSSCWGANITVLPGRELVGMPVVLLEQGAGAVVTALWRVSDSFSRSFVPTLYKSISALGIVEAVSASQRQAWSTSRPRDWASYVLYLRGLEPSHPVRWIFRAQRRLANLRR